MTKRMTWATRKITNVSHYWVVGERLLEDRENGWYVSSWSDSAHIINYWVEEGTFYQASINWVTGTKIDLEIGREMELDPERKQITLEAIDQWKNHSEDPYGNATIAEPASYLAAA